MTSASTPLHFFKNPNLVLQMSNQSCWKYSHQWHLSPALLWRWNARPEELQSHPCSGICTTQSYQTQAWRRTLPDVATWSARCDWLRLPLGVTAARTAASPATVVALPFTRPAFTFLVCLAFVKWPTSPLHLAKILTSFATPTAIPSPKCLGLKVCSSFFVW